MGIGVSFNETSLLFLLLVAIIFFSKEKIGNIENKIYNGLLITSLLGNAMAIPLYYIVKFYKSYNITTFLVPRLYLIYLLVWGFLLSWYFTHIITKKEQSKVYNFAKKIFAAYLCIVFAGVFLLPIKYYSVGEAVYTFGPSVTFTYAVCAIHILYWFICFIRNFNIIKSKKCIPIIAVFVLGAIVAVIQKIDPSIRLMTVTVSFITTIMYFTIENPDMKMVNELYKNKSIMEQTYEDKSNFLFEMTQEVRMPVTKIHEICTNLKEAKKLKDYSDNIEVIDRYTKELDYIINDILNVNSMDLQNVKFVDNKYDFEIIYNEVVKKIEAVLPSKVSFNHSMIHNLPLLYGDGLKLKQIIYSILMYSVKRTNNGYIELSVNAIERYDAIRLIVTIRDSGSNISMDKINEILSATGAISKEDIELMNKSEISMELCQKVIKLLGGHLLIRNSELGGEIIMTVDQKIDERRELNVVDAYERSIAGKSVAVVNQDKEVTKYLRNKFKENNINGVFLLNGNDLIDIIKGGKKFEYIIVQNEMKEINGYTIKKKLEDVKGFNMPIVIMIDEKSENLKDHFIEDGFKDYLLVSSLENEANRILEKY